MTPDQHRGTVTTHFDEHWLAETLRLRESQWGPLEDAAESGKARAQGGRFETRCLVRAQLLAQREGLTDTLKQWRGVARLTFWIFSALAFVLGCGAAAGALGSGGAVNLAPTLVALLGLNTVAMLLWLSSFFVQPGAAGSVLAKAWLTATRKLARGPNSALLPRALLELLARQRLQRWGAGLLSHWFWALALSAALLTLLGLLATRRYTFHWETTLLAPETFVFLVQALGSLPALLGFTQPDVDVIRSSSGQLALPETAHVAWSVWLMGVVFVYGLLPRIAALLLSYVLVRRRLQRLTIDSAAPGVAELRSRLMPASENTGIDQPAPALPTQLPQASRVLADGSPLIGVLGLELPSDLAGQSSVLPNGVIDLGVVDTREQRHQLLDALRATPAQRLLVCCDARQTPDRGSTALLRELASLSAAMAVALLPEQPVPARMQQWQQQLLQAGFAPAQILMGRANGLRWLSPHDVPEGKQA